MIDGSCSRRILPVLIWEAATSAVTAGVEFFSSTFRKKLVAANKAAKDRGYEFTDPQIVTVLPFSSVPQRLKDAADRWKRVTDAGGTPPPAGATADPMVPDEVIDNDTDFKVSFKVILLDKSQAKTPTTPNK